MILSDHYTQAVVNPIHDAFFGPGLPYIFGAVYAVHRLVDARAEIAAVNEAMTTARHVGESLMNSLYRTRLMRDGIKALEAAVVQTVVADVKKVLSDPYVCTRCGADDLDCLCR